MAFITQCFSLRGLALIAGANIANALCNLFNVAFIAMGNAVGIITGQKLGACDFENAKKDAVKLMRFSSLASVSLTAILIAGARFFPLLYNTTDDVRQIGTMVIIIYALFFPVDGFLNALYFTLRSGGRTFITFLFDSVFTWVLPVPLAFILCRFTSLSAYLVLFILQSCSFVKMAVGLFMFHKDIWVQNLVEVKPN